MITETELSRILDKAEERFKVQVEELKAELDKLYSVVESVKDDKKTPKTTNKA
jgi:hypothetical protein